MNVVHCLTLYLLPVGACRQLPYWWGSLRSEASFPRSPQSSGSDSDVHTQVSQVNDSLYVLHKPEGTPNMQIVFFHGLQFGRDYSNAHVSTWKSHDGGCIWPQTWLVEDFPRAHVLSVCYPGLGKGSNESVDMFIIGENLVWDLLHEKIGSSCPVVLVGHSIGGLVIKQLCCYAHDMLHRTPEPKKAKLQAFLNSIKGIFFYSTPHHGSTSATKLKRHFESPLLTYFGLLSTAAARLNFAFDQISKEHYKWLFAGLCETLPTNLGPFVDIVVTEAAARDRELNLVEGADHFSICRPRSKINRNYSKLSDFIRGIPKELKKVTRSLLAFHQDPIYVVLKSTMMEVQEALEIKTTGPVVVTLSGGPGQGKTSMARYLALNYQNASTLQDEDPAIQNLASDIFVDGVVFLSCRQDMDRKGLLFKLWQSLGYELFPLIEVIQADARSSNVMQQAFKTESFLFNELQKRLSTQKVLIVLDDVREAKVIKWLLFLGESLKFLITTQVQQLWTGTGCKDICLNPPTSEEACQILINHVYGRHVGGHPDITPPLQDAIDALVEKADRHPLVLANMATKILRNIQAKNVNPLKEWKSTVKYFEDLIQDESGNSSVVLFNRPYPRNMKASMTMALTSLTENEQTLLLVAAIFKSQPVPEVVVKLFFKRLHGTLAKFSSCSEHLQSNNFIQIDSAEVEWSTVPESRWSLHAMRQLFIGIIMESELKKNGDKILECNTQADVVVELLLLYGQDQWRDQAANRLGIPMGQFQIDSSQPSTFQLAPIKSFAWLLHADPDEDWEHKSHQLAQQILQKYIHCHELDDNSVATLLSTKETYLYALEAIKNFLLLDPPRVVIPKTVRTLVNLIEANLEDTRPSKVSIEAIWLLAQDFCNLPDSKLAFTSVSTVFEKLVALLGPDGSPVTRQFASATFGILAGVVQDIPALGLFPNLIERLVLSLDKDRTQGEQDMTVKALGILACKPENSITIGQFPNFMERLMEFWAEDVSRSERLGLPFLLLNLMKDVKNLIKIGRCPNVIEKLVALLAEDGLQEGQFQAAKLLAKLVDNDEFRRNIGQTPDAIERLVAVLAKDVSPESQQDAALALAVLSSDAESRIKARQIPNFIHRLVSLLGEHVSQDVQQVSALTLANLCFDAEIRTKVGQFPNAIDRLVALLAEQVDDTVKCNAALSLAILSMDAANGLKVGQFPNAIDRLVALLADDKREDVKRNAAHALGNLCAHPENLIKVGQFPNVIERLVALLAKDVRQDVQRQAALTLGLLCLDPGNQITVLQVPNFVQRLVALLDEDVSQVTQQSAALTLSNICLDVETRIKVGQVPNVVERLVALLAEEVDQAVKCNAARALGHLSMDFESRMKVGQFPNVMERLVALLGDDVSRALQEVAALALGNLCVDAGNRIKVGQVPNAIDRLVAFLAEEVDQIVKCNAARALANLSMDVESRIKVGQFPNVMERLVALLGDDVSRALQGVAALALGNLCMDAENLIKAGQVPNAIDRLVALLTEEVDQVVKCNAARALGHLSMDVESRMKVGQFPNVMERLVALLGDNVSRALQEVAALALGNLCVDAGNRIKVGQVPNAIDRLVALLAEEVDQIVKCNAARALGNLSLDVENMMKVGQFPNVMERLVALLREDLSEDARQSATYAMRNLALNVTNRIKIIAEFPNVIETLLALIGEDVTRGCLAAETIRLLSLEVDGGDYEGALQAYEDGLVANNPECRYLLNGRWFAKAKRGHFEEAITDVNWYIELGCGRQLGLQERGIVKLMRGDLRGALTDLDESLSLEPDVYECLKHRGLVKFLLDDNDGARADAELALTVKPATVDTYEYQISTVLGASSVEFLSYKLK